MSRPPAPAPRELFRTERLVVRALDAGDVDALLAVYGDARAMRWVDDGRPLDRAGCERWVEVTEGNVATRGYGMCALVLAESGEVVGFCGLVHPGGQEEPELKYALARDRWGLGLATEAARGMFAYGARHFGLERVIATTAPENEASQRVLRKTGMRHAESRREGDGTPVEVFVWRAPERR